MMNRTVRARAAAFLSCALLLCVVSACGYATSHVSCTDRTFPPRPSTHPIQVLRTSPERAHIELAEVFVQPTPGTASIDTKTPESCIDEFKKRARELGGDAIVITELSMAPAGTVGQGSYSGRAIAIRWKE